MVKRLTRLIQALSPNRRASACCAASGAKVSMKTAGLVETTEGLMSEMSFHHAPECTSRAPFHAVVWWGPTKLRMRLSDLPVMPRR